MKKIIVFVLLLIGVFMTVFYFTACDKMVSKCLNGSSIYLFRTFFHLAIPVIISLIMLFFLSDNIFKKWLILALISIFVSIFFISITPEYGIGLLDPNKEEVSIWMSSLFLIISIVMIIIWTIQEKKKIKK